MFSNLYCHSWFYDHGIDLITLLVSIATLALAFRAYQKFLRNKFNENQLSVVQDLIASVQQSKNYHLVCNPSIAFTSLYPFNLFGFRNDIDRRYFDHPILFHRSAQNQVIVDWRFYFDFINHPLLPTSIAETLKQFEIYRGTFYSNDFILISSSNQVPFITPDLTSIKIDGRPIRVSEFIALIEQLESSIRRWIKQYGITDINM